MEKSKIDRQKEIRSVLLFLGLIVSILSFYLVGKLNLSRNVSIPLSLFALICGLLYEYRRISNKWSSVLYLTMGSLVLGFFSLLMVKEEGAKIFDKDLVIVPVTFCLFFVIIATIVHEKKIIAKLTEGIALLLSLAILYRIIDTELIFSGNIVLVVLILLAITMSLYSVFHALSYKFISKGNRFILSIWSSLVLIFLAADNIFNIYMYKPIESASDLLEATYISIQYFLLGVSSIYMAQNFFMIMGFFPGRGTFFNKEYFKETKKLKIKHIIRFSPEQIPILNSLICIVFALITFGINYFLKLVPVNFAIWIVFISYPIIAGVVFRQSENNYKEKKQQEML